MTDEKDIEGEIITKEDTEMQRQTGSLTNTPTPIKISRWPWRNKRTKASVDSATAVVKSTSKLIGAVVKHNEVTGRLQDIGTELETEKINRVIAQEEAANRLDEARRRKSVKKKSDEFAEVEEDRKIAEAKRVVEREKRGIEEDKREAEHARKVRELEKEKELEELTKPKQTKKPKKDKRSAWEKKKDELMKRASTIGVTEDVRDHWRGEFEKEYKKSLDRIEEDYSHGKIDSAQKAELEGQAEDSKGIKARELNEILERSGR